MQRPSQHHHVARLVDAARTGLFFVQPVSGFQVDAVHSMAVLALMAVPVPGT